MAVLSGNAFPPEWSNYVDLEEEESGDGTHLRLLMDLKCSSHTIASHCHCLIMEKLPSFEPLTLYLIIWTEVTAGKRFGCELNSLPVSHRRNSLSYFITVCISKPCIRTSASIDN